MNQSYSFTLCTASFARLLVLLAVAGTLYAPLDAQIIWEPANNGMEGGWANGWAFGEDGTVYGSIGSGLYQLNQDRDGWTLLRDTLGIGSVFVARDGVLLWAADTAIMRSEDRGGTGQVVATSPSFFYSFAMDLDGVIWTNSPTMVYRSDDNGRTWIGDTIPTATNLTQVIIDRQGRVLVTSGAGVFRSDDQGSTWTLLTPERSIRSLVVTSSGALFGALQTHYIHSTDDGLTWNIDSLWVAVFATAPNGDLFAGVINRLQDDPQSPTRSGIYRSTDDGTTWALTITLRTGLLTVAPDGTVWATAGNRILRSSDNGATWQGVVRDLWANSVIAVNADPSGTLYATVFRDYRINPDPTPTTYSALYRSTSNGDSWTMLRDSLQSSEIQIDSSGGIYVYADRFQHSTDRGDSWKAFAGSRQGRVSSNRRGVVAVAFPPVSPGPVSVTVSTDGGMTWADSDLALDVSEIAVTPADVIVARTYDPDSKRFGLYRSADFGRDWQQIRDTLYGGMGVSPDGELYISGPGSRGDGSRHLYRTNSDVTEWTLLLDSIRSGGVLFAGDRAIFRYERPAGYRSTDRGDNWEQITARPRTLVTASNHDIYAMMWDTNTVQRSTDNGRSWEDVSSSITRQLPRTLAIGSGDRLFAGTHHGGVYRTVRPAGVKGRTTPSAAAVMLGANTPNPFTGITTIPLTLPHRQRIRLNVHDLLGREVAVLVDGVMPAGHSTVTFDASGLAGGMYVVTLVAGGQKTSMKVVVR